jgi:hypothetical protein
MTNTLELMPVVRRVILSFLDPKKPIIDSELGGAGNFLSSCAEGLDKSTIIIYVDRKKHFNSDGTLKKIGKLPGEFNHLRQAEKVEIHAHGSAGSGVLSSDYWAYPLFENDYLSKSKYLSWLQLRSPFPQKFTKIEVASLLKVCQNQPSVEIFACESAKKGKNAEASFIDDLNKEVIISPQTVSPGPSSTHAVAPNTEKPVLGRLEGYRCNIELRNLYSYPKISVPVTNVEKIIYILFDLAPIIPIAGYIPVFFLSVTLIIFDMFIRAASQLSPWPMMTEEEVKEATNNMEKDEYHFGLTPEGNYMDSSSAIAALGDGVQQNNRVPQTPTASIVTNIEKKLCDDHESHLRPTNRM